MRLNPLRISRNAFVVLLLLQTVFCRGQSAADGQEFHSKEFDWTISIPNGFVKMADSTQAKMQQKGTDLIEKAYDMKVDNQAKTMCAFRSDPFHYFEANYQPFDVAKDGDYETTFKGVSDILYGTFVANMPKTRLDSSFGREIVAGKEFHVFHVTIYITPQVTMHMLMYSRLFGKREFTVTILYVDEAKGKALLEAWRQSHFGKS